MRRGGGGGRPAPPGRRTVIDSIRPPSLAFLVGQHPGPVTNEEVRLMAEPESPEAVPAERIKRTDHSPWNWLLLIPIVVPLVTPLYNHDSPRFAGFPAFY